MANVALIAMACGAFHRLLREIPAKIPMHWDVHGEVDRYGSEHEAALKTTKE